MNAPAETPIADRMRRRALRGIQNELKELAIDAGAIVGMGDVQSDASLVALDKALERVRVRARSLLTIEAP